MEVIFTFSSGVRWERESLMTLVVLTLRLEVSWQVTFSEVSQCVSISSVKSGMSRDKCGAAAVAGLMASIAAQQPQGVKVGEYEHYPECLKSSPARLSELLRW